MADRERAETSRRYVFSPAQEEFREVVRRFCAETAGPAAARRLMESELGYDPGVWKRLGAELGVPGLTVPARYGGSEEGLVTLAIAVEELGAALLCGPVLGTLGLAVPALTALTAEAPKAKLLPRLAKGEITAAFAVPDRGGRFAPDAVQVEEIAPGTLEGTVRHVVDGHAADVLIVAARTGGGVALFAVDGTAEGLRREPMSTMDLTRRQAEVTLRSCSAEPITPPREAAGVCDHAFATAGALLAAEQVGGCRHLLELSVAYARDRFQFGRPIGSFQAVKHRLADMLVRSELARSAAYHAAWALQDGSEDPHLAAGFAQAVCGPAYQEVAAAAVQVHGGIAFTWEHQAHLYYKRAVTDALLLGGEHSHRDRIAALVLDAAGTDE